MKLEKRKRCIECGRIFDGDECPECGLFAQEYEAPEEYTTMTNITTKMKRKMENEVAEKFRS